MKFVRSDGRCFEVRDIGPVIYRLHHAPGIPLPIVLPEVMDDEPARDLCRRVAGMGLYGKGEV